MTTTTTTTTIPSNEVSYWQIVAGTESPGSVNWPKWVGVVLGVLGGLLFISLIIIVMRIYSQRRHSDGMYGLLLSSETNIPNIYLYSDVLTEIIMKNKSDSFLNSILWPVTTQLYNC